ncbi:hypothetical protein AHiyo8_16640 [Arthrobacter sp. Hiyo8]|nr:hypothetical protein AHiyo8_16640 [Arthrobacter sp. Hiyo8]
MSGLDSLYQQLILEHSKARSGGDLAKLPAREPAPPARNRATRARATS